MRAFMLRLLLTTVIMVTLIQVLENIPIANNQSLRLIGPFHDLYLDLLTRKSDNESNFQEPYWISTRNYCLKDLYFYCFLNSISNGGLNCNLDNEDTEYLSYFRYSGTTHTEGTTIYTKAFRPMVEIDLNKVLLGHTGTGTKENKYSVSEF